MVNVESKLELYSTTCWKYVVNLENVELLPS